MTKLRVLFVAGLDPIPGGAAGGQVTAARTLLHSGLADAVTLMPLSSTMACVPPPPVATRLLGAGRRLLTFLRRLPSADVVLVFAADGLSLVEKGLMCIIARLFGRGVVLRLSSGYLVNECRTSTGMRWWLRLTLRCAHVVCSQGTQWTRYFARYSEAKGKIVRLGNGIALEPLPPRRPEDACRKRLVYVGWIQRQKGVFDALEVLKIVRHSHPDCTLTLAGGGRDVDVFRERVNAEGLQGCVSMTGWIQGPQVRELLAQADVFLFPSHAEGLPNALLEAMAAGLPAVATRVGAVPDVIADGQNGFLADVEDFRTMATAVTRLFSDRELSHRIGANARAMIESTFDIERIWPRYAESLERAATAVGRGGRGRPAPSALVSGDLDAKTAVAQKS